MIVEVTRVFPSPSGARVEFASACGCASARWVGDVPTVGARTVVELATDDVLRLGENAAAAAQDAPSLSTTDGLLEITGQLTEHPTEVDTITLAFADGRLAAEVERGAWTVGRWYTVRLATLALFDTHL